MAGKKKQDQNIIRRSLCMIVKNEEQWIGASLKSVVDIVDEIIVVDTGSTDTTVSIAQSYGATIIPYIWRDDFSHARNVSIEHAQGDWILFIDADEVISPSDVKKIPQLCENTNLAGYILTQRNYTTHTRCQNFCVCTGDYAEELSAPGFVPVERIGLFRNRPEIRFSGIIHETVAPSIKAIGGVVGKTDIVVHHYGHLDTTSRSNKTDYYLTLGLRQIQITPDDAKPYYDVGLIYFERGDFISAEKNLLRAHDLDADYEEIKENLAILYFRWHKFDRSLVYIHKAMEKSGNREQLLITMGTIYDCMNRADQASVVFEQGTKMYPHNKVLKENLGFAVLKCGNAHRAEAIFDELIAHDPLNARYVFGGIQAKSAAGNSNGAVELIELWNRQGRFDESIIYAALKLYADTKRCDEFRYSLKQLEEKGVESGEYWFFKGLEAQWQNKLSDVVEYLKKSVQRAPYLAGEIDAIISSLNKSLQ